MYNPFKTLHWGTSLVVQWLRIHLPMQRTRVWPLTGKLRYHMCKATKPAHHKKRACAAKMKKRERETLHWETLAPKTPRWELLMALPLPHLHLCSLLLSLIEDRSPEWPGLPFWRFHSHSSLIGNHVQSHPPQTSNTHPPTHTIPCDSEALCRFFFF